MQENKHYKQGYADGVSDIKTRLITDFQKTLQCELESYDNSGEQDDILKGWIECLQFALHTLKGGVE